MFLHLFPKLFFKFFFKFFLNQTTNIIVVSKKIKNEIKKHSTFVGDDFIYNVIDKKFFQNITTV